MTAIPQKKLTLRAVKISNPSITKPNSGILGFMEKVLTEESKAADRRMPLNAEDPDRELLANYIWPPSRSFLFGMMLRITPAESGGMISEDLFNQRTITMADVAAGSPDKSQYKDHFYFAVSNDYLVTTLPGNINIGRLQTYINWLLERVRGDRYFEFTELTRVPKGVCLSDIKSIEFRGGGAVVTAQPTETKKSLSVNLKGLASEVLSSIIKDTESLESIKNSGLIEAKLLLTMKSKPRDMEKTEFQRVMGAIATNVTNDSGIRLKTKAGNSYTGEAIKVKKTVSVECVGANRILEEQLKQEMERFLNEIRSGENE